MYIYFGEVTVPLGEVTVHFGDNYKGNKILHPIFNISKMINKMFTFWNYIYY